MKKDEPMISPSERMTAEKDGAIGWMVFNNPARRNAISLDMWQAIPPILDAFEQDPEIRVVVLRGAGDQAFVSGADISQFEQQRSSAETVAHYDKIAEAAGIRLQETRKPTIAMIHGFCIGGGLGVALQCDLRIAADTARFAVPAAKLGLGYRWSGVKKLVDTVGPAFAKEIFFTARQFDASEALAMGLVNRVLPSGEIEAYVRRYAAIIAENAPLTVEAVKGVIQELQKPGAEIDRKRCEALVARCFESQDYVEGRRAFMEKRKPVFAGK
jgi:enoyl-CoA hydratase